MTLSRWCRGCRSFLILPGVEEDGSTGPLSSCVVNRSQCSVRTSTGRYGFDLVAFTLGNECLKYVVYQRQSQRERERENLVALCGGFLKNVSASCSSSSKINVWWSAECRFDSNYDCWCVSRKWDPLGGSSWSCNVTTRLKTTLQLSHSWIDV